MRSFTRSTRKALTASTIALLCAACGGGDAVHGTWNQPNGQISVPAALGGGTVASNNTLVFDDSQAQSTFTLTMNLSFSGLTDTLTAKGTYTDNGSALALDFTGFDIAQGSGDTSAVGSDGSQCITLNGLGGAAVCFQTSQSDGYQIANDTLTLAINNEIVGGQMGPTTLTLTRK
jgi:hypothetical protein